MLFVLSFICIPLCKIYSDGALDDDARLSGPMAYSIGNLGGASMKCKNKQVPLLEDFHDFSQFVFNCPLGTEVDYEKVNYGLLSSNLKKIDREKICYTEAFDLIATNWPEDSPDPEKETELENCTEYIDDTLRESIEENCA